MAKEEDAGAKATADAEAVAEAAERERSMASQEMAAAKARSGSWSRVTVESVRAPRTRANPRCMSIGTAKNAGPLGLAPLRYQ